MDKEHTAFGGTRNIGGEINGIIFWKMMFSYFQLDHDLYYYYILELVPKKEFHNDFAFDRYRDLKGKEFLIGNLFAIPTGLTIYMDRNFYTPCWI